MNNLCEWAVGW